jgi:CPA1 family monovalent cation:H+ antiporter
MAYIAIAASLVIPGLTLSPLVRRLGLGEEAALAREEARARVALAHAALTRIEELATREELSESVAEPLRLTYEQRIHRWEPEADGDAGAGDEAATVRRIRAVRRELIAVERARLRELRRRGEISAESVRRIEHELDLEESRLS